MSASKTCSNCGAALPEDVAGGRCPECLLRLGLEAPAGAGADGPEATVRDSGDQPPERIGPYRILEKLGEGGMGEVWLAEQTAPVHRRVALKVIKQGLDTRQVMARFEAERQALALMDHRAIAKVYEAGATPRGRPYFAMEHVRGVPITEHCDRHKLSNRERLDLFLEVCEGVQHAHQKAVIHRDLKPSNVLVMIQDGRAVPKIIDFGVAKATGQRLTERTLHTRLGVVIGTPAYMSPEQAEMTGQDVDTRTDVYSLGVMLYELLVGALPFDPRELERAGFESMVRRIREDEPPTPSTRLRTLGEHSTESAARRRTNLPALRRELSGDLDWIVMRALEKDRVRRYGSPQELAADLHRYLSDEPVLAGPPSAVYRMGKFVRRHRLGVGIAAAGVLVLAAFAGTMALQARRIARERDRVRLEAETARQVSDFLVQLFEVADPTGERSRSITAREVLDEGAERIERELAGQPLVQARLMHTMGIVYQNLGFPDRAEGLLEGALRIREERLGERHPDVIESLSQLGWLGVFQGRLDEAESLQRRALGLAEDVSGPNSLAAGWASYRLGAVLTITKRLDEAPAYLRRAMDIFESELGPDSRPVSWCVNDLGNVYGMAGRCAEAEPLFRRSIAIKERNLGSAHPDVAIGMSNLAECLMRLGRLDEASSYAEKSVKSMERALGPDHPALAIRLQTLGEILRRQGRLERAREVLDRALVSLRVHPTGQEPETECYILETQARLLLDSGDYDAAERVFEEAIALRERRFGPDHLELADVLEGYAELLRATGRASRAAGLDARAAAIRNRID